MKATGLFEWKLSSLSRDAADILDTRDLVGSFTKQYEIGPHVHGHSRRAVRSKSQKGWQ